MRVYRRLVVALLVLALTSMPGAAHAVTPEDYDMSAPQALTVDHLYAEAALLIDAETGETLLAMNAGKTMYPASTTKILTGLLTAITTAFCGPVAFIGLAVPHIARMLLVTDNHQVLMPATILTGAVVALICNIICVLPGDSGVIPLNATTPLFGAPVIIYVIAKQRHSRG